VSIVSPATPTIRRAVAADVESLAAVIAISARELSQGDYTPA
jgi:hypothetical protein